MCNLYVGTDSIVCPTIVLRKVSKILRMSLRTLSTMKLCAHVCCSYAANGPI